MAAIECKNVRKTIKDFQLKNISFSLEEGYICGIVGENGSGKTTLMNILAGLDRNFTGEVMIQGISVKANPIEAKNKLAIVSEGVPFYKEKSPIENGMLLGKYYKEWNQETFSEWLNRLEIHERCLLSSYSKGTQMKFQVAFAMAHNPSVLILDEPTAGFDPVFRKEFLSILQETLQNEKTSVLMSTHITSELDKIADYILVLENGSLKTNDSKENLAEQFGASFVVSDLIKGGK